MDQPPATESLRIVRSRSPEAGRSQGGNETVQSRQAATAARPTALEQAMRQ